MMTSGRSRRLRRNVSSRTRCESGRLASRWDTGFVATSRELTVRFIVIPRHSRDGLRVKVKNVLKGGKETEHARPELCAELKQAISEQRRIDASHAEARGSVLLAQSNLASAFPGAAGEVGKVGKEADVRLVLPLEPWKDKSKKGEKKKIERSFLKGSKNMFTDKGEFGVPS